MFLDVHLRCLSWRVVSMLCLSINLTMGTVIAMVSFINFSGRLWKRVNLAFWFQSIDSGICTWDTLFVIQMDSVMSLVWMSPHETCATQPHKSGTPEATSSGRDRRISALRPSFEDIQASTAWSQSESTFAPLLGVVFLFASYSFAGINFKLR